MLYPKLHSLFKREGYNFPQTEKKLKNNKLFIGEHTTPEFEAIDRWTVTEKIDGTNVRIIYDKSDGRTKLTFGGRTDNAQFPTFLHSYLQDTFSKENLEAVFSKSNYTVLFGEGYGHKIQSGGYYRSDAAFILFDVYCSGWWLDREGVEATAKALGIDWAKPLFLPIPKDEGTLVTPFWTKQQIIEYVKSKPKSILAKDEYEMEGVVARSAPLMMFRSGGPIMFKLKCKDL